MVLLLDIALDIGLVLVMVLVRPGSGALPSVLGKVKNAAVFSVDYEYHY